MRKNILVVSGVLLLLSACSSPENDYDASGLFEATEVVISAEGAGKLLRWEVAEGTSVEAHRAVGIVDTVPLVLRRRQIETGIQATQSRMQDINTQVGATREQLATQERELKRVQALVAAQAATTKQLDDVKAAVDLLGKQLEAQLSTLQKNNTSLAAEVENQEVQLSLFDDQLSKSYIASPISGTVLSNYVEPGEFVSIGKPLMRVADMRTMILRAYITGDQLTSIKLGDAVQVATDFGADQVRRYRGTVSYISGKAEFTPKNVQTRNERANLVYAVKITVPNDGYLKIGMYGDVKFTQP